MAHLQRDNSRQTISRLIVFDLDFNTCSRRLKRGARLTTQMPRNIFALHAKVWPTSRQNSTHNVLTEWHAAIVKQSTIVITCRATQAIATHCWLKYFTCAHRTCSGGPMNDVTVSQSARCWPQIQPVAQRDVVAAAGDVRTARYSNRFVIVKNLNDTIRCFPARKHSI